MFDLPWLIVMAEVEIKRAVSDIVVDLESHQIHQRWQVQRDNAVHARQMAWAPGSTEA